MQIAWDVKACEMLFLSLQFLSAFERVSGEGAAKLTALHNSTETMAHYDYGLSDVDLTAIRLDKLSDQNPRLSEAGGDIGC